MTLTIEQEVERVWHAKKTLMTTLFFLNRYIPPIAFAVDVYGEYFAPSAATAVRDIKIFYCKGHLFQVLMLDLVEVGFIECTLIICTHALFRKRLLLWFLIFLSVIAAIMNLVCFAVFLPRCESWTIGVYLGIGGCLGVCSEDLFYVILTASWIPLLLLEILTFVLTAWKSYQSLSPYSTSWTKRVIRTIMRDRLIYFIAIIGITVLNFLAMWAMTVPITPYTVVALQKGLQPAICTRLLLDVREAADAEDEKEKNEGSGLGSIAFRAPEVSQQSESYSSMTRSPPCHSGVFKPFLPQTRRLTTDRPLPIHFFTTDQELRCCFTEDDTRPTQDLRMMNSEYLCLTEPRYPVDARNSESDKIITRMSSFQPHISGSMASQPLVSGTPILCALDVGDRFERQRETQRAEEIAKEEERLEPSIASLNQYNPPPPSPIRTPSNLAGVCQRKDLIPESLLCLWTKPIFSLQADIPDCGGLGGRNFGAEWPSFDEERNKARALNDVLVLHSTRCKLIDFNLLRDFSLPSVSKDLAPSMPTPLSLSLKCDMDVAEPSPQWYTIGELEAANKIVAPLFQALCLAHQHRPALPRSRHFAPGASPNGHLLNGRADYLGSTAEAVEALCKSKSLTEPGSTGVYWTPVDGLGPWIPGEHRRWFLGLQIGPPFLGGDSVNLE
ncbi:unnamed protein product [Cyclocybe aegerita]|uniref:DUF6533 domain-containing protein n=1 Tax=Cyclocybe aegerita TaxID=1973307 RepID=A0A8S0W631_CYCAE|nr:unnamed protein product [Cyclocybe aegerita]